MPSVRAHLTEPNSYFLRLVIVVTFQCPRYGHTSLSPIDGPAAIVQLLVFQCPRYGHTSLSQELSNIPLGGVTMFQCPRYGHTSLSLVMLVVVFLSCGFGFQC